MTTPVTNETLAKAKKARARSAAWGVAGGAVQITGLVALVMLTHDGGHAVGWLAAAVCSTVACIFLGISMGAAQRAADILIEGIEKEGQ